MRNVFTGGTQTTIAPRPRGPGTNRGGGPHRGGGGGGGGGGRVPKGGLYGGRAGKAAANQDPTKYFTNVVNRLLGASSGDAFEDWQRTTLTTDLSGEYSAANAGRQRLDPIKWLRQTYGGAGFSGKRGRAFAGGTLAADSPEMQARYQTHQANDSPLTYLLGRQTGAGDPQLPAGGNPEYARWWAQEYAPRLELEYQTAQQATPGLNVSDWYGGVDPGRAQREFDTFRANADPAAWAVSQARQRGDLAANGNAQFEDWYGSVYAPQLQQRFEAARTGDANLNADAFLAGIDPNEARRLFANRAPQQRQPGGQPAGGRWSWWA